MNNSQNEPALTVKLNVESDYNKIAEEFGVDAANKKYPNYESAVILTQNVPYIMRDEKRWLVWDYKTRDDGKKTKIPMNYAGYRQDQKTINYSFESVVNRYASISPISSASYCIYQPNGRYYNVHKVEGIGFSISSPFVFIDYDQIRDENGVIIDSDIEEYVDLASTYTEISPSGTGLHQIGLVEPSDLKSTKSKNGEMYFDNRFTTVTGNLWNNSPEFCSVNIIDPDILREIHEFIEGGKEKKTVSHTPTAKFSSTTTAQTYASYQIIETDGSDDDIIEHLYDHDYSVDLLNGEYEKYTNDHSSADYSLCRLIAKYTRDPAQIDRIFRRSGLMRDKWNTSRGNGTYGSMTISNALGGY